MLANVIVIIQINVANQHLDGVKLNTFTHCHQGVGLQH